MQQASTAYVAALRSGTYRIASRLEFLSAGAVIGTGNLSTCTVNIDRGNAQRRRISLTAELPNGSPLVPTTASSIIAPFGNEVRPSFGITYKNGSREFISLGVYPITTATVEDTGGNLVVSLSGYDRSWVVSSRKLETPYTIAAGTDIGAAIQSLIGSVYAGLTYNIVPTPGASTSPAVAFKEGDDPWDCARTLAASCGLDLYFDVNGAVTGLPIPTSSQQATAWDFTEGTTTAPKKIGHTFTREGISNDFIVSGVGAANATTGPVRASAADTNVNSPTYTGGPFGDVPTFISSNLVNTVTDAQNAATNALAASLGGSQLITLDIAPNPLFDVDDVITVTRGRLHLAGTRFVIDTIKHTMRHDDTTTITGRWTQ